MFCVTFLSNGSDEYVTSYGKSIKLVISCSSFESPLKNADSDTSNKEGDTARVTLAV